MNTVLTQAGSALAALIPGLVGAREIGRVKPIPRSSKYAERKLDKAYEKHVQDISKDPNLNYNLSSNYPKGTTELEGFNEARRDPGHFASSSVVGQEPQVVINPNADRVYLAHELGHLAAQQTDVGQFVNNLRQNPKLAQAMGISLLGAPVVASALQAGDEDLDESIALAALTSAPVLADEALATINAQQSMDKAGLRTSLGQRG